MVANRLNRGEAVKEWQFFKKVPLWFGKELQSMVLRGWIMNYFVISNDGQKYGPADVPTLNQWALRKGVYFQLPCWKMRLREQGSLQIKFQESIFHHPIKVSHKAINSIRGQILRRTTAVAMWRRSGFFVALAIVPCCPLVFGILMVFLRHTLKRKATLRGKLHWSLRLLRWFWVSEYLDSLT